MKLCLLLVAVGLLCSAAAAAPTAPVVRISSAAPLTVVGQSFAPRERLRIVVRFDGTRKARILRTNVSGRFTARFVEQTVEDRCSVGVSVTRASGRTVAAKLPAPFCPPAIRP